MKIYPLDKAFKTGVLYRSEPDKFFVINAAGTDSTTKGTLKIEGAPVLEIINAIARLEETNTDYFPPLNLNDKFIVVPPDKTIEFTGSSASSIRVIGKLGVLAPGESLPSELLVRYAEQRKRYYTYLTGINGIGASATWAAGAEYTVINFTVPAGEKHRFDRYLKVRRTGIIADDTIGAIAIRLYTYDSPLDVHDSSKAPLGIDTIRGHYYAGTTSYYYPCSVEEFPIELPPGGTLKITAVNISGADIVTAAGEEAKVEVYIIDEKQYV